MLAGSRWRNCDTNSSISAFTGWAAGKTGVERATLSRCRGKFDVFKVDFETEFASPAVLAIIDRATDELVASGQADRALQSCNQASEFTFFV